MLLITVQFNRKYADVSSTVFETVAHRKFVIRTVINGEDTLFDIRKFKVLSRKNDKNIVQVEIFTLHIRFCACVGY